jgi:outer membrane immunogenic protein
VSAARSAFAWGGFAGINWQSGKGIFGFEADALPATRNFAVGCATAGTSCQMDIHGVYSVRPKFGWVIGSTLVYATGGVALAPWQSRVLNLATVQSLDHANGLNYGVAVGAGVEHKLAPNLGVRAEFLHYGIAGWDLNLPPAGSTANQFQSSVARVGFAWYFH